MKKTVWNVLFCQQQNFFQESRTTATLSDLWELKLPGQRDLSAFLTSASSFT